MSNCKLSDALAADSTLLQNAESRYSLHLKKTK